MNYSIRAKNDDVKEMMDLLYVFCDACGETPATLVNAIQDGRWKVADNEAKTEVEDILNYFMNHSMIRYYGQGLPEFGSKGVYEINNSLTFQFACHL